MSSTEIFQVFAAILGSGAISAGITGWFTRHKTKAEASASLTEAASHASSQFLLLLQQELRETKDELKETKREADKRMLEADGRMREFEKALWEHRKWDAKVVKRLEQLGVDDLDPPPNLWV